MASAPRRGALAVAMLAAGIAALAAGQAQAAPVTEELRFTAGDGVALHASVTGEGPLEPRPSIVEFTPYATPACCPFPLHPDFNLVSVDIRGTGRSDGRFDSLGPRTQADIVELLEWACGQPWSDGRLGLYGFSASAIAVYHTLHEELPCVETAVLMSGTDELYRDLLYPGGVPNGLPALVVLGGIGGMHVANLPDRLGRDPATALDGAAGLVDAALDYLGHPTLDPYWRQRQRRPDDANGIPILMINGFFDVESRGPFEAFRALRDHGARLLLVGAHDGAPAGTDGGAAESRRWFDHHLRGIETGVEDEPRVLLRMADGRREDMRGGRYVEVEGDRWPLAGTRWSPLYLDPTRSGTATSLNDGTLSPAPPERTATQIYPAVPSLPTATDPYTTSNVIGEEGNFLPAVTQMNLAGAVGLSYTSGPLAADVLAAGPAALEVRLASTAPETDIYAVISDVAPGGAANPMAAGRLRTAYPEVDPERSLRDPDSGAIVQPYGRFDRPQATPPGAERTYQVEFWPIGNRFKAGHRIRLDIVGASGFHMPGLPALNTVRLGGEEPSRLLFPTLHGEDLSFGVGD